MDAMGKGNVISPFNLLPKYINAKEINTDAKIKENMWQTKQMQCFLIRTKQMAKQEKHGKYSMTNAPRVQIISAFFEKLPDTFKYFHSNHSAVKDSHADIKFLD